MGRRATEGGGGGSCGSHRAANINNRLTFRVSNSSACSRRCQSSLLGSQAGSQQRLPVACFVSRCVCVFVLNWKVHSHNDDNKCGLTKAPNGFPRVLVCSTDGGQQALSMQLWPMAATTTATATAAPLLVRVWWFCRPQLACYVTSSLSFFSVPLRLGIIISVLVLVVVVLRRGSLRNV